MISVAYISSFCRITVQLILVSQDETGGPRAKLVMSSEHTTYILISLFRIMPLLNYVSELGRIFGGVAQIIKSILLFYFLKLPKFWRFAHVTCGDWLFIAH
jgi:hypothetical protein